MCSSEDCEKLWFLYKLEGEPKGVSIEQLERQGGPDFPALISCDGMTDSEKKEKGTMQERSR